MSRMVSFVVLVAILVVIAALFFRVMANFLLPMFLALLLAVMFGPLHRWFIIKCQGRDRLAAGLTTASILLIFLVPMLLILSHAISEGDAVWENLKTRLQDEAIWEEVAQHFQAADKGKEIWSELQESLQATEDDEATWEEVKEHLQDTEEGKAIWKEVQSHLEATKEGKHIRKKAEQPPEERAEEDKLATEAVLSALRNKLSTGLSQAGRRVGLNLKPERIEAKISPDVEKWVGPAAMGTAQFAISLFVMIVSLYYFLADGPWMVRAMMRLSPLDDRYEEQLIDEFENISRAVVLATVVSAVVQGLLAGVGYYLAGLDTVFLLTALTMLFAMVPFVGAAAVWVPVCLYLFFVQERPTAAIVLAIYGAAIVSTADNVIKPIILHGRSNLHPLLALLSVLGGVQALGPIGIFVGPMVVAFLHALLNMLHTELAQLGPKAALSAAGTRGPGDPPPAEPARASGAEGPPRPEPQT